MRKPSTPISSQNRNVFSKSAATSGLFQLRSGWLESNRCKYHWPSATLVHAEPLKIDCQLFGGSSPFSPLPSKKWNRARSGDPLGELSAALNQAWSAEKWLGTMSAINLIPWLCAASIKAFASLNVPNRGSTSLGSETS